jgi:hypothetical protein
MTAALAVAIAIVGATCACDAPDTSSLKDLMAIIGPMVTWLVVLIGWTLIAKDNNHREQRKEVRAHLNDVIKDIHACAQKGDEYYRLNGDEAKTRQLAAKIKYDLCNLGKALGRIHTAKIIGPDALTRFWQYRREITGADFESNARRRLADDDVSRTMQISSAATDLIDQLERDFFARYNTYAAKWWAFWRR